MPPPPSTPPSLHSPPPSTPPSLHPSKPESHVHIPFPSQMVNCESHPAYYVYYVPVPRVGRWTASPEGAPPPLAVTPPPSPGTAAHAATSVCTSDASFATCNASCTLTTRARSAPARLVVVVVHLMVWKFCLWTNEGMMLLWGDEAIPPKKCHSFMCVCVCIL